jgi:metallo-beta-lactamase class B
MPPVVRRAAPYVLIALLPILLVLFRLWKGAVEQGGQQAAEPFQIAGNLYYVGASDASVFLLTGPEGDVLLDGGFPGTARLIKESIATLGFKVTDVKTLINSDPYSDQAGGLAELQQASGAQLWSSDASSIALSSGGDDPALLLPLRVLHWTGVASYPAARVDHIFNDGDTIRLGPIVVTAHITGGHTRGCTSWSFQVQDGARMLNVVSACSLDKLVFSSYAGQSADFERSFATLRSLPVDIWVTARARAWSRYPKYLASKTAKRPADAFIDREGYRAFIDRAEADLRQAGR